MCRDAVTVAALALVSGAGAGVSFGFDFAQPASARSSGRTGRSRRARCIARNLAISCGHVTHEAVRARECGKTWASASEARVGRARRASRDVEQSKSSDARGSRYAQSMGWLARVIVPSVTVLVGCAAIANLGDATTADNQTDGSAASSSGAPSSSGLPGSSGLPASSSGTPAMDGGTTTAEAGVDAAPTCPAPKKLNNGDCNVPNDCCSNACASDHRCRDTCAADNTGCGGTGDCCVGLWCPPSFSNRKCTACRPNDAGAAAIGPVVLNDSCCSGNVDPANGRCIP